MLKFLNYLSTYWHIKVLRLQPGDILVVDPSKIPDIRQLLEIKTKLSVPIIFAHENCFTIIRQSGVTFLVNNAPIPQSVEGTDLKSVKCRFESY